MCISCGDCIDFCLACSKPQPWITKYGNLKYFYVGDKYCEHMKEKYGHDIATWADGYGTEDDKETSSS